MRGFASRKVKHGSNAWHSPEAAANADYENYDTSCDECQSWETVRLRLQAAKSSIADTSEADLVQLLSGMASKEWKTQVIFYDPFSAGRLRSTPQHAGSGTIQESRRVHHRRRRSKERADAVANVVRDLELLAAKAGVESSIQKQDCKSAAPKAPVWRAVKVGNARTRS